MRHVFSIDPGLSGTGLAEWRSKELRAVHVIHFKKEAETLIDKCNSISDQVTDIVHTGRPGGAEFYIEMPQKMTNVRGIAAQGGAVYKLTFLVGHLAASVRPYARHVEEVPIHAWKGQLPKDVVQRRIIRTLGVNTCTRLNIRTHAWDAVGIGLWATGVWK